jgi:HEPN domain-containing protein
MNDLEHAKVMLSMADKDLKALTGMTDANMFAEEVFGFHAQQAVEKALKAWIAALGTDYPFTHDISRLLTILKEQGCPIEPFLNLVEYNAFAVQFRYEAFEHTEEPIDRMTAIKEVQKLVTCVHKIIDKGGEEE